MAIGRDYVCAVVGLALASSRIPDCYTLDIRYSSLGLQCRCSDHHQDMTRYSYQVVVVACEAKGLQVDLTLVKVLEHPDPDYWPVRQ